MEYSEARARHQKPTYQGYPKVEEERQPDTSVDDAKMTYMTVPEFYANFGRYKNNRIVFVINDNDKKYAVGRIITSDDYPEIGDNNIVVRCTDQEGYNNINDYNFNADYNARAVDYKDHNINLKFNDNTYVQIGTITDFGFKKDVMENNLFPIYPLINHNPKRTQSASRRQRQQTKEEPQTLIQKTQITSSDLIKKYGSPAAAIVAILVAMVATIYSMSPSHKGGGPEDSNMLSTLSKEEHEALLTEIEPKVDKNDLKAEISKLPESEQKAVKEKASEYFSEFNLEEGETVFGNLFGKEGGKRKRTNKKRKSNKRKNNKKKSNRR